MTPAARQAAYYRGIRMVPYDLLKEVAVAMLVLLVLVAVLAAALSSPDVPPLTIQKWSQDDPVDLATTVAAELSGQSASAQYGPPYDEGDASVQSLGPFSPQKWAGVHIPVDPANDFVLQPLRYAAVGNPDLTAALSTWDAAGDTQRSAWLDAYAHAVGQATVQGGHLAVPSGDYGPVATLVDEDLQLARSGALDGLLLRSGRFYQTDFTRPLLFMVDGGWISEMAKDEHLVGDQWGMMNETGQYPGQTWLWLYTVWYQLPAFQGGGPLAANADLVVVLLMVVLTALLALVPFIPVLRDVPRWIPVYRLIWRSYYRLPSRSGTAERPMEERPRAG
ncbi:MAG: hypothetical protein KGJ98_07805 [Chloroflexota bacterium]|nr:hypothetical protein [Chloroflexota bacterium]MDE3102126.1 hypothetical protein [Chloroflexota bacterium]